MPELTELTDRSTPEPVPGMTLREWYAGMALPAILSHPHNVGYTNVELADKAFNLADALIARSKE